MNDYKLLPLREALQFLKSSAGRYLFARFATRLFQSKLHSNIASHFPTYTQDQLTSYYFPDQSVFGKVESLSGREPQQYLLVSEQDPLMLPLQVFESKDRGLMAAFSLDLQCPLVHRYLHELLPEDFEVAIGDKKLTLTPNGRTDSVLELTGTFQDFLKGHGQVSRYWRKRPADFKVELVTRNLEGVQGADLIVLENTIYHLRQKYGGDVQGDMNKSQDVAFYAGIPLPVGSTPTISQCPVIDPVFDSAMPSSCRTLATYVNDQLIALSFLTFDFQAREVCWLNTLRLRQIYKQLPSELEGLPVGNLVLLKLIEYLYLTGYGGWTFNMGIDTFDYKKVWKPTAKACQGFQIT